MPTPPSWLQAWRRMTAAFFHAELYLARVVIQAVRLRIRPRSWVSYQDPDDMEEKEFLIRRAHSPCQHDKIKRYGNRHGRYSSCLSCGKKWKWSDTRDQWLEDVPRQDKLPLPLPCSSNAPGYIDKKHTPALSMGLEPSPLVQTVVKTQALEDTHCSPSKPARGALPKSVRTPKRDTRRRDQEEAMEENYDWDFVSP